MTSKHSNGSDWRFASAALVALSLLGLIVGTWGRKAADAHRARPEAIAAQEEQPRAAESYANVAQAPALAAAPAAPPRADAPGVGPETEHYARPATEWQGMLVNKTYRAYCDSTSQCGLATSCKDHKCGACAMDDDCSVGERCVLDHCVKAKAVTCRVAKDCGAAELCVLSGYSSDVRGNGDMRSLCEKNEGGNDVVLPTAQALSPVMPVPVDPNQLLEGLKEGE